MAKDKSGKKGFVERAAEGIEKGGLVSSDYMGYVKAVFRTMGFIFIASGAFLIFWNAPLLKFIPFFILSIAIMSSPSGSVSTDEEVGLSVLQMVLGGMMIIFFAFIFWDIALSGNWALYLSLVFIATGFFLTVPDVTGKGSGSLNGMVEAFHEAGEKMGEGIKDKLKGFGSSGGVFKIIVYFILIIIAVYAASVFLGVIGSADLAFTIANMTTLALGFGMAIFSAIIGIKLGRNLNGMILGIFGGAGLAMGTFALGSNMVMFIIFSMVVGMGVLTAVPVNKAKTFIGIPILVIALMTTTFVYPDLMGESIFGMWWPEVDYQLDSTIGPLLQGIHSPLETMETGYACLINPVSCYQNWEPETSTQESTRSVEITRVEPVADSNINALPKELMVLVTVENRGKEDAKDVTIKPIIPAYAYGTKEEEIAGTVQIICNGTEKNECKVEKLLADDFREFTLVYHITEPLERGNYITYGASVEYDLRLVGQVDVMVMNQEYYNKLARNKELSKSEQVTEDTGGPVRMGLALMRNEMPVMDDLRGVPVMLYMRNEGPGTVVNIESPMVDISDIEGVSAQCTPEGTEERKLVGLKSYMEEYMDPGNKEPGLQAIEIKSGESISSTCISDVPDISVDQRTFAIDGEVVYRYSHENERKINVDFGTPATCTCSGKEFKLYVSCGDKGINCRKECVERDWEFVKCEDYVPPDGDGGGGGGDGGYSESSVCTDYDGGQNYFIAGYIENLETGEDGADVCSEDNPDDVTEYYCNGDNIQTIAYTCPKGCAGGLCNGGEYVIDNCHDYDGGLDYFEKSWANVPGSSAALNDNCADSDGGQPRNEPGDWVAEANCYYLEISGNPEANHWTTRHTYYRCPHGCECSGNTCACKEAP